MGRPKNPRISYRCSSCEKRQEQVRRLIAGPGGIYICDECVDLCQEIIEEPYNAPPDVKCDQGGWSAAQAAAARGKAWMLRDQWDALVRGENCPLCATLASPDPADDRGYMIADLGLNRLRLAANQSVPGYCL